MKKEKHSSVRDYTLTQEVGLDEKRPFVGRGRITTKFEEEMSRLRHHLRRMSLTRIPRRRLASLI